ncbi:MAG: ABC transporter ATP-binding protein [Eubacteriales bacterium]|nr:ABC transporter ATP-binding protein [Eubacteriales bacterium]
MDLTIQTNDLTKTIKGKELVSGLNLHVKKGEIYGFLGPNGAGKTTTMKLLTNLWKPDFGTVELFGEPLRPDSCDVFKRMASIIEFPVFYDRLSGKKNLELHCEYMGYYSPDAVKNALELLGLGSAAAQMVKKYSLGMKQRLGLARAILTKPELLILDEPANGLDPAGIKQVRDLLKMLSREYGMTVLMSSHILSEVEPIADTIGFIDHGKMIQEISMADIKKQNLNYIEIGTSEVKKAAYLLTEKLHTENFKIFDGEKIRVYEDASTVAELTRTLTEGGVPLDYIVQNTESLEDYFLKMTGTGER